MITFRQVLPEDFETMALQTFFNLMLNGWVTDKRLYRRNINGNGMQSNYHVWGDKRAWHAADEWRSSEALGHYSSGETTVWFKECLVWHMQYNGWYEPRALHLLKSALRENYTKAIWHGGRGPETWSEVGVAQLYVNSPEKDSFSRFSGIEFIGAKEPDKDQTKVIGLHHYRGGFMFTIPEDKHGH